LISMNSLFAPKISIKGWKSEGWLVLTPSSEVVIGMGKLHRIRDERRDG
jgi:hypothetical protein